MKSRAKHKKNAFTTSNWNKQMDLPEPELQEVKVEKLNNAYQKVKDQKATVAITESIDYLISVFEQRSKEQLNNGKVDQ